MTSTDTTEEQLARDLTLARNRQQAAGEWLTRAASALQAARNASSAASSALNKAICDDDSTPEFAALYTAACEASAAAHAAGEVHRKASEECADWSRLVFEADEALGIRRGGRGYEL